MLCSCILLTDSKLWLRKHKDALRTRSLKTGSAAVKDRAHKAYARSLLEYSCSVRDLHTTKGVRARRAPAGYNITTGKHQMWTWWSDPSFDWPSLQKKRTTDWTTAVNSTTTSSLWMASSLWTQSTAPADQASPKDLRDRAIHFSTLSHTAEPILNEWL